MTKVEAMSMLSASSESDLGENLLEISCAYWLEKGVSADDILEMVDLILAGEDANDDAES